MQTINNTFVKSKGLLHEMIMKSYTQKRLHIYDGGNRNSISGVRATIYGATGFIGPYVGAVLGQISSDVVYPHCHEASFDDDVKELKTTASLGQSWLIKHMNFNDLKMIDRTMANSNVVINLLGPRKNVKKIHDFEFLNVEIPRRLARAAAKNPEVIRFIHFSALGADPKSPSIDLRTKFQGEEAVLSEFPNATIMRPATVFGPNDYFTRIIRTQRDYFYHYNVVTDDCTAKKQPIYVNDVALAVMNALKMHETCGKTFELGGPHVYSMLEIYEIIFNIMKREPKLVYFPHEIALKVAQYIKNWDFLNVDMIVKNKLDIVVSEGANTISDLYVQPVNFPNAMKEFLYPDELQHRTKDEMER